MYEKSTEIAEVDELNSGISAFKALMEGLRGMLALSKEVKDAMPEGTPQKEAFEEAVTELSTRAEKFKVELANEWGYPLCRCTFPPQIMIRVGKEYAGVDLQTYLPMEAYDVYKCPKCGLTDNVEKAPT